MHIGIRVARTAATNGSVWVPASTISAAIRAASTLAAESCPVASVPMPPALTGRAGELKGDCCHFAAGPGSPRPPQHRAGDAEPGQ